MPSLSLSTDFHSPCYEIKIFSKFDCNASVSFDIENCSEMYSGTFL